MSNKSYLFARSPIWNLKIRAPNVQRQPDAELLSWLRETGSLTKRLRGIYHDRLKVRILFHRWQPAFNDECKALAVPGQRYVLIREVLLHAGDQALILARTVLPEATIRIAHRNLSHLGTRPLGEVIFAYPDLERRQRQFALADARQWSSDAKRQFDITDPLWGRRTIYAIHGQPLLVSEFFLPGWLNPAGNRIR